MMRRVIFLDIDGVLAPIRRWDRYGDLDPACIQVLNEIAARGGADVVVSSTWRYDKTVAELQEILEAEGFTGFVLDKTPTGAPGADRGEEIAAWLTEHAVDGYVIIDDHLDMGELERALVHAHRALATWPSREGPAFLRQRTDLARLCLDAGKRSEALEELRSVVGSARARAGRPDVLSAGEALEPEAEAELDAAEQLRKAAEVIMQNPAGLELRRMQMITEVGAEQNTMTIIMMPSEFVAMARAIADTTGSRAPRP